MSEIMEQMSAINQDERPSKTMNELTDREKQLMQMLSNGYTSDDLAERLNLSHNTINSHRKNILKKLKTVNIAEAIAYCFRNKIIE